MLNFGLELRNISVCETGTLSPIALFLKDCGCTVTETQTDLRYGIDALDDTFQLVLSLEVFEHLKDQTATNLDNLAQFKGTGTAAYAKEIARVLRPGGYLVLTSPNPCSYFALKQLLTLNAPMIFRPNVREYTKAEIESIFVNSGLVLAYYQTHNSFYDLGGYPEPAISRIFAEGDWPIEQRGDNHFFVFQKTSNDACVPAKEPVDRRMPSRIQKRDRNVLAFYNAGEALLGEALATFFSTVRIPEAWSELCRMMTDRGSDKGSGWHNYTLLYNFLFSPRRLDVRSLFEVGLGSNFTDVPSSMGRTGTPGASLRGWRDYFPQAQVYGADIDERILFSEERISTYYVDQMSSEAIDVLWQAVPTQSFDIMIDDGLHIFEANASFMEGSFHKVGQNGLYIIEDIITEAENLARFDNFFRNFGASGVFVKIPNPVNQYDNCIAIFMADGDVGLR